MYQILQKTYKQLFFTNKKISSKKATEIEYLLIWYCMIDTSNVIETTINVYLRR